MKKEIHVMTNKEELDASTPNPAAADEAEFDEATTESTVDEQPFPRSQRISEQSQLNATSTPMTASVNSDKQPAGPFFSTAEAQDFRSAWKNIQVGFVDDPRSSLEQANQLITDTVKHLTQSFSTECQKLEEQWDSKDGTSTEDLRLLLRRYRSFFERLVAM